MTQRIDYYKVAPKGLKNMLQTEKYLSEVALNAKLKELIKIRISQINKCAFCINTHALDARKAGETEERIYGLDAWEECSFYSDAEKVALKLAEHVTNISTKRVSDTLYKQIRQFYSDTEYINLILLINQINSWNRIAISMGNSI